MFRGRDPLFDNWTSGDASVVIDRARRSRTQYTIVSPLLSLVPRGEADAFAGNEQAATVVTETEGLLQWVVVNPLQPDTFDQADHMLGLAKCVGIKWHPEEHRYPITEHGRILFEHAAKHCALVLTHSGEAYSKPEDFIPFANDFPDVKLILAHIGCTDDEYPAHQVRGIQMSKHDNVYADTSSARSMISGIIEYAVKEVGPERILFGTDTPLYHAPCQRARIDEAEISDEAKRLILRANAAALLGLE